MLAARGIEWHLASGALQQDIGSAVCPAGGHARARHSAGN
jgi:hypothetical protein